MNTIQSTYINALLADAAYTPFIDEKNKPLASGTIQSNLTTLLTQPQANYLLANFDVLTQTLSPTGGFDAVVWRGKTGTDYANQVFVSMRGTKGAADIVDDVSMALRGIPYEQVRDMANWWMRATAKPGDVVNQVKITATGNLVQVFTFTQDKTAVATGELYGKVAQIAGVNGHSLGGYLATAFTRLFGANVKEVNTFNSAGFSDAAASNIKAEFDKLESLLGTAAKGTGSFENAGLKQTNYRAGNGVDVASNNWGEMPYWAVGFNQYGQKVSLYQEDTLGWNPFANHSLYKQTDYLALGAMLSKLDSKLSFEALNNIIKAGSNDMKASYEGVLDAMRQLVSATPITATLVGDAGDNAASRADFHTKLAALQANSTFKSLAGKLSFSAAAASATTAKTDFAQFLSLYDLTPFSVSVSDATAKTALLNARSDVAAKWQALADNFSDKWLADRYAMQGWILQANNADNQGVITGQPQNSNGYFEDTACGKTIKVGTANVSQMRNFKFGDAADNSLTGGGLSDALYGGDGNDTLDGMGSPDWLEGGKGLDTYRAGAADKIVDIDGKGVVYMDGVLLSGGSRNKGEEWFVSADGTTRYRELGKLILVVKGGQTMSIDGTLQPSSKLANGDTLSGQQGLGISLITKGGDSDNGNDDCCIGDSTGTMGAIGTVMPWRDPMVRCTRQRLRKHTVTFSG